ncbi:transcriptional regulator, TetR family [Paenibacillus tianmuensis]|uniref:Transcriptional regulator, TetR family n=1 Tax=Paenibacillus tianmuensis TaxID=624147 RepID=A0A1G4TGP4_9BACL|nr:TetR/AcrR family transcriptional regulator [Paenibacillus tianmuensis]SCW80531.1 transcriptional regulator, TetR family [Paenibacillus tianmuensis]
MSKRERILEEATNIIREKGINNLTLDAVAAAAEISKGGFLYHFHNKEDLIRALNEQALAETKALMDEEMKSGKGYTLAYLNVAALPTDPLCTWSLATSVLAGSTSESREVLSMWETEYQTFLEKSASENIPPELALVIRLVCDGLCFSDLFNLAPVSPSDRKQIVQFLTSLREKSPTSKSCEA